MNIECIFFLFVNLNSAEYVLKDDKVHIICFSNFTLNKCTVNYVKKKNKSSDGDSLIKHQRKTEYQKEL